MLISDMENKRILNELALSEIEYPEDEIRRMLYDTSEVIKRALIHDLEESITGDILYPLKHENSDELTNMLRTVADKIVENQLFSELPFGVRQYYIKLWRFSKDNTKEGRLVEAIDKFEIVLFCLEEMEIGNPSIVELYNNAMGIITRNFPEIISLQEIIEEIIKYCKKYTEAKENDLN